MEWVERRPGEMMRSKSKDGHHHMGMGGASRRAKTFQMVIRIKPNPVGKQTLFATIMALFARFNTTVMGLVYLLQISVLYIFLASYFL